MFDLNVYPYPVSVHTSIPGFIFLPPGRKAARGRENDLLLIYYRLKGQTAVPAEGVKNWMDKQAEAFQHNPGTATSGMRSLIEAINSDLYARNIRHAKGGQVTLDLLMAVVKREMIYLAACGTGRGFLVSEAGNLLVSDVESAGRGLGVSQSISIRFTQSILAANDYLLFSLDTPEQWTADYLDGGQTLAVEALQRRLFSPIPDPGQGVLIRFQEGSGKFNLPFGVAASGTGNETAQTAPKISAAAKPLHEFPFKRTGAEHTAEHEVSRETPVNEPSVIEPRSTETAREAVPSAEPVLPGSTPLVEAEIQTAAAEKNVDEKPEEARIPLIDAETVKSVVGKALRGSANVKDQAGSWAKDTFQKVMPGDPDSGLPLSKGLLITIAIVIPVLIAIVAVTLFFHNAQDTTTPQYVALAQQFYQQASAQNTDSATKLSDLQQAIYWLDKADQYGKSDDATTLRNQVQSSMDDLEGVIHVDMSSALTDVLLPGVNVTQLVVSGTDLYALDNNSGKVLHFTLNGAVYQQDTAFSCGPDTKDPLNTMGKVVDMSVISPDNAHNATLLAIDAAGDLDYCVPQGSGYVTKLPVPKNGWGEISAIALDGSDLYVLDRSGAMVYDFTAGDGMSFSDEPDNFFDEDVPTLNDVVDMEEGSNGELYLLRSNGQMTHCTYSPVKLVKPTTCQSPATFIDTRSGQDTSVTNFPDAQFVQMRLTQAPDSSLYLLDASKDTVYHFSYARSLQRILHPRLTDGTDSSSLTPTAFAVSSDRMLFIAYNNQIYFGQIQ